PEGGQLHDRPGDGEDGNRVERRGALAARRRCFPRAPPAREPAWRVFSSRCQEPMVMAQPAIDPLPSWNDGPAKDAILDFVRRVTMDDSSDFVPVHERVAVFDNDGTLWCEMPVPVQAYFAADRIKALLPEHPEWRITEPFKSQLAGDVKGVMAQGIKGVAEIAMATHAGMTTDEFETIVRDWLATAKHPKTGKPYTKMIYQPMLELLQHLHQQGFSTFIVSGGGVEFMRVFAEDVYGVPPENVIGSSIKTHFEMRDGTPVLQRDAALDFF